MSALDALLRGILVERWQPLPVGPGDEFGGPRGVRPIYWVSSLARVAWVAPDAPPGKRVGLKTPRPGSVKGRRRGHSRINLAVHGPQRFRTVKLHRLVAAAWGVPGQGPLVRHLDGDARNNVPSNLRRGTASENLRDAYAHGARGQADDPYPGFDPALGF